MSRHLLSTWLLALTACTPDVPPDPSFQRDVMPVLAANCIRCHGVPTIGGAPEGFRLDVLEDTTARERRIPEGDPACTGTSPDPDCFAVVIAGASSMAGASAERAGDDDRPMPPRFGLDDHQVELLEVWAASGALRGEPRPDNSRPTATVEAIEWTGLTLRLRVHVADPDRDVVGGSLHARIAGRDTVVGLVHSGIATVSWDATGIAAGSYPLSARLDDGAAAIVVPLGMITVGGS